jgi:hypothetical protein
VTTATQPAYTATPRATPGRKPRRAAGSPATSQAARPPGDTAQPVIVTTLPGRDDPRAWVRAAYLLLDASSPGDKLPSRAQVTARLGVSADTASRAFRELARLGLVRLAPGRGYYSGTGTGRDRPPRHGHPASGSAPGPTGGHPDMTTTTATQTAPSGRAAGSLAAIAASLTARGISASLGTIGGTPVLTNEQPAPSTDPTTISLNPDPADPTQPLECTCLWTPPPGTTPQAIAATITAILAAVRPAAAVPHHGCQDT